MPRPGVAPTARVCDRRDQPGLEIPSIQSGGSGHGRPRIPQNSDLGQIMWERHVDIDNVELMELRSRPVGLGDLQQLTMVAVVRLGDEAYGAAIRDELGRVAGRMASVQTVWVTLVRLEEQGLTASTEVAAPEGGRPRRIFRITPQGWRALKEARASMARMWEGVVPP